MPAEDIRYPEKQPKSSKGASLPPHSATEQVSLKKKKKVSSTVPFVSGRKPDTEETSKQKKL